MQKWLVVLILEFLSSKSIIVFTFVSQAIDAALSEGLIKRALILSLRLNEDTLIKKCVFAASPTDIPALASSVPSRYLQRLIEAFAGLLENCPHLEFILRWCQVLREGLECLNISGFNSLFICSIIISLGLFGRKSAKLMVSLSNKIRGLCFLP